MQKKNISQSPNIKETFSVGQLQLYVVQKSQVREQSTWTRKAKKEITRFSFVPCE